MSPEELDVAIEELELRLERLRALYDQYFQGIERIEPAVVRKDVDRRIWMLRREQIKNTGKRFRLNTIVQRYNTFQQYWTRICREIENGTYRRHVQRAQRILAAPGNSSFEAELARANADAKSPSEEAAAKQPEPSAAPSPPKVSDVSESLDSFPPIPGLVLPSPAAGLTSSKIARAKLPPLPVQPPPPPPLPSPPRPPMGEPRSSGAGTAQPARPKAPLPPLPRVADEAKPPAPPRAAPQPPKRRPEAPPPLARPPVSPPTKPQAPVASAPARAAEGAQASRASVAGELSEARLKQLHGELVAAKQQLADGVGPSLEALSRSLRQAEATLLKQHGSDKRVDFAVIVKNGRAMVKPTVR